MKTNSSFTLGMLIPHVMAEWSDGKIFLEFLIRELPELSPEYIQNHEPVRTPINDLDEVSAFWQQPLLWKRKKKIKSEGSIWMGDSDIHTTVIIHSNESLLPENHIVDFLLKMPTSCFSTDLCYAHMLVIRERELFPYELLYPLSLGLVTHHLRKGIPLLPWATVFGAPYVNLLGIDVFLSAPAQTVIRLNDQQVYIQVTESLNDIRENFDDFARKRAAVMDHLSPLFQGSEFGVQVPPEIQRPICVR